MGSTNNFDDLCRITYKKLEEYNLIKPTEKIILIPNYEILLDNKKYSHYIIECITSKKKYFLKVFKNRDNMFQCNDYIKGYTDKFGNQKFSTILVPKFEFNGMKYYITSFVNGESIDKLNEPLTNEEYKTIGKEICKLWFELTKITTSNYSEKGEFFSDNASTIFKRKLENRLIHPVFKNVPDADLKKAYFKCCNIIDKCEFSKPSLIHMDVKPANIIYNKENGLVTLIDFEHARFGDIDFGWVQILLSGYNSFGETYEKQIYPHIVSNHLSLIEALKIPKFKCYIFYQTACNLIYYYKNNQRCPLKMQEYFYDLLYQFAKE